MISTCTQEENGIFGILSAPQMSCYSACWNCVIFPLCISSISHFLRIPLGVYVRENPRCWWSVVWWHSIGGSLHSEIAGPNDSLDSSWVGMCSCWRILTIYYRCMASQFQWPCSFASGILFCSFKCDTCTYCTLSENTETFHVIQISDAYFAACTGLPLFWVGFCFLFRH